MTNAVDTNADNYETCCIISCSSAEACGIYFNICFCGTLAELTAGIEDTGPGQPYDCTIPLVEYCGMLSSTSWNAKMSVYEKIASTCDPTSIPEAANGGTVAATAEVNTGDSIPFTCLPNWVSSVNHSLSTVNATCNPDGSQTWILQDLPCVATCAPLATPTNGQLGNTATATTSGRYVDGHPLTVTCNAPYELLDPTTANLVCNPDGQWYAGGMAGLIPECRIPPCDPATLNEPALGGTVTNTSIAAPGSTVGFQCQPGWVSPSTLTASTTVECAANGTVWETANLPCIGTCVPLTNPTNGTFITNETVLTNGRYLNGTQAIITCSQGYEISDTDMTNLTCDGATGVWIGANGNTGTPTCQNIDECASGPCQNGGNCTDGLSEYTCSCPQPFGGLECQHECPPGWSVIGQNCYIPLIGPGLGAAAAFLHCQNENGDSHLPYFQDTTQYNDFRLWAQTSLSGKIWLGYGKEDVDVDVLVDLYQGQPLPAGVTPTMNWNDEACVTMDNVPTWKSERCDHPNIQTVCQKPLVDSQTELEHACEAANGFSAFDSCTIVVPGPLSGCEARRTCTALGGRMSEPNTILKAILINEYLLQNSIVDGWIGLTVVRQRINNATGHEIASWIEIKWPSTGQNITVDLQTTCQLADTTGSVAAVATAPSNMCEWQRKGGQHAVVCEIPPGGAIDFCDGLSCLNGGTCNSSYPQPDVSCICPPGFAGTFCQFDDPAPTINPATECTGADRLLLSGSCVELQPTGNDWTGAMDQCKEKYATLLRWDQISAADRTMLQFWLMFKPVNTLWLAGKDTSLVQTNQTYKWTTPQGIPENQIQETVGGTEECVQLDAPTKTLQTDQCQAVLSFVCHSGPEGINQCLDPTACSGRPGAVCTDGDDTTNCQCPADTTGTNCETSLTTNTAATNLTELQANCTAASGQWIDPDNNCFILSTDPKTWSEARQNCTYRGGILAEINGEAQHYQVANAFPPPPYGAWLGERKEVIDGCTSQTQRQWTSGTAVEWLPEIEDHNTEAGDCGLMSMDNSIHHWQDTDCANSYSFICQYNQQVILGCTAVTCVNGYCIEGPNSAADTQCVCDGGWLGPMCNMTTTSTTTTTTTSTTTTSTTTTTTTTTSTTTTTTTTSTTTTVSTTTTTTSTSTSTTDTTTLTTTTMTTTEPSTTSATATSSTTTMTSTCPATTKPIPTLPPGVTDELRKIDSYNSIALSDLLYELSRMPWDSPDIVLQRLFNVAEQSMEDLPSDLAAWLFDPNITLTKEMKYAVEIFTKASKADVTLMFAKGHPEMTLVQALEHNYNLVLSPNSRKEDIEHLFYNIIKDCGQCIWANNTVVPILTKKCVNDTERPGRMKCVCHDGFKGDLCDVDIQECRTDGQKCQHGKCFDRINGTYCECEFGWRGQHCSEDKSDAPKDMEGRMMQWSIIGAYGFGGIALPLAGITGHMVCWSMGNKINKWAMFRTDEWIPQMILHMWADGTKIAATGLTMACANRGQLFGKLTRNEWRTVGLLRHTFLTMNSLFIVAEAHQMKGLVSKEARWMDWHTDPMDWAIFGRVIVIVPATLIGFGFFGFNFWDQFINDWSLGMNLEDPTMAVAYCVAVATMSWLVWYSLDVVVKKQQRHIHYYRDLCNPWKYPCTFLFTEKLAYRGAEIVTALTMLHLVATVMENLALDQQTIGWPTILAEFLVIIQGGITLYYYISAVPSVMIKFYTAWHTWRKNYNPYNKDVTPQRTFQAYYDLYHGRISTQEFDPANAAIQKELSLKDGTPLRLEPAQRMAMLRKMRWGWKTLLDKFWNAPSFKRYASDEQKARQKKQKEEAAKEAAEKEAAENEREEAGTSMSRNSARGPKGAKKVNRRRRRKF